MKRKIFKVGAAVVMAVALVTGGIGLTGQPEAMAKRGKGNKAGYKYEDGVKAGPTHYKCWGHGNACKRTGGWIEVFINKSLSEW